nr:hypothetical protein L203_05790 [Cryptococcus depauperatus CBS 7841]
MPLASDYRKGEWLRQMLDMNPLTGKHSAIVQFLFSLSFFPSVDIDSKLACRGSPTLSSELSPLPYTVSYFLMLSLQLEIHVTLFRDLSSFNHFAMAQLFNAVGPIASTNHSTFCLKHSRTFSFQLEYLIVAHVDAKSFGFQDVNDFLSTPASAKGAINGQD